MCHCHTSLEDLSDEERAELLETHSIEELKAEHSEEELATLGVSA